MRCASGGPGSAWVATGACAGCPYRGICHESRQHVMDARGMGRHTSCRYYLEFDRQMLPAPRAQVRLSLRDRVAGLLRTRRGRGLAG